MSILAVGPANFSPHLIIFDKDGTLIDFHATWATWAVELARRLETCTQRTIAPHLFDAIGYDAATRHIRADGALALAPLSEMHALCERVLCAAGLSCEQARAAVACAWFVPNPVAHVQPLADLHRLFAALRAHDVLIAIATSDDRALTEATLDALGLRSFVAAIVCADDAVPIKPAADMILHLCRALGVPPAQAVMVGDSLHDMLMGRAAGVALVVGVLSGLGTVALLSPHTDVLIPSVGNLLAA